MIVPNNYKQPTKFYRREKKHSLEWPRIYKTFWFKLTGTDEYSYPRPGYKLFTFPLATKKSPKLTLSSSLL